MSALPFSMSAARTARRSGAGRQRGFTLIEAVVVIAITGIVAAMVATFIVMPVRGYTDTVARADIADTADTALRRIGRDVRLALPNSVRVTNDTSGNYYLELLLTRTGGRYLSDDDNAPASAGTPLSFVTSGTTFNMVGPLPAGAQTIQPNSDSVVVYNLGPGMAPADAYSTTANQSNRALITAVGAGPNALITMQNPPFAAQQNSAGQSTPMPSPNYHFHVVTGPVTYMCKPPSGANPGTLTRYWNYTISEPQPTASSLPGTGLSALVATGVTGCNSVFSYTVTNATNAVLEMNLNLAQPSSDTGNGGTVGLFQQVHVDNTP